MNTVATTVPSRTRVLVLGGGPAGATAAAFLARAGIEVTLIERDVFPRYHIGESLLPSCLEIVELLGARELLDQQGFQRKPGAYLEWKGEQWTLDFGELRGNYQHSYQVPRAEFDHMLLKHAATQGVQVFEGTSVRQLASSWWAPRSGSGGPARAPTPLPFPGTRGPCLSSRAGVWRGGSRCWLPPPPRARSPCSS